MRVASWVASASTQIANVSGAPITAAASGARNGRSSSGSVNRSRITAKLGRGEREEHAEAEEPGKEAHRLGRDEVPDHEQRGGDQRRADDRRRGDQRSPLERPERVRKHLVLPHRVRNPARTGDRRRDGGEEHERARQADRDPEGVRHERRQLLIERRREPHDRRAEPLGSERLAAGERRDRDDPDRERRCHDEPDPGKEAARQRPARLARLGGQVRNRLQPVYASIATGSANGDVAPGRRRTRSTPTVSASGEKRKAKPRTTSRRCEASATPAIRIAVR